MLSSESARPVIRVLMSRDLSDIVVISVLEVPKNVKVNVLKTVEVEE